MANAEFVENKVVSTKGIRMPSKADEINFEFRERCPLISVEVKL